MDEDGIGLGIGPRRQEEGGQEKYGKEETLHGILNGWAGGG
jgi:hypothetical protein